MGCPYCIRALNWLDTWGLSYDKIQFTSPSEKMKFYQDYGVRSVPQIFVNEKRIGGWDDLQKSDFKKKVESGEDVTDF